MNYDHRLYAVIILPSGDCSFKTIACLRSVEGKFVGIKWENITVQDMVRLYGVMLRVSK